MSDEARDELALELFIGDNGNQPREASMADWAYFHYEVKFLGRVEHYKAMAEHALAAGYSKPRTITTAAELDALPDGSMILDSDPDALLKVEGGRWLSLHDEDGVPYISSAITFPATVLYEAGATA